MSTLDWAILLLYCGIILGVSLYFRARAGRSVEEYFLADRNLPWWIIGFADVAGYTGGGQGFMMVFFVSGFAGLWLMAWIKLGHLDASFINGAAIPIDGGLSAHILTHS